MFRSLLLLMLCCALGSALRAEFPEVSGTCPDQVGKGQPVVLHFKRDSKGKAERVIARIYKENRPPLESRAMGVARQDRYYRSRSLTWDLDPWFERFPYESEFYDGRGERNSRSIEIGPFQHPAYFEKALEPRYGGKPEAVEYLCQPLKRSLDPSLAWVGEKEADVFAQPDSKTGQLELPGLEPGFYVIELAMGSKVDYCSVLVSDLMLASERIGNQALIRVFDRQSGFPVSGAKLWVSRSKGAFECLESPPGGVWELNLDKMHSLSLMAQQAEQCAYLGFEEIVPWEFSQESQKPTGIHIFTDRPVYRPGDRVFFRVALQGDPRRLNWARFTSDPYWPIDDSEFGNPRRFTRISERGLPFRVSKEDEKAERVGTALVVDRENLCFAGSCPLPASAKPGRYVLSVGEIGASSSVEFQVMQYEKPRFRITLDESQAGKSPAADEDANAKPRTSFRLKAQTLSGVPVPKGAVEWFLHKRREDPASRMFGNRAPELELLDYGQGNTDASGEYSLELSKPINPKDISQLLIQVTDGGGQRRSLVRALGREDISRGKACLSLNRCLLKPDEPLAVSLRLEGAGGQRLPEKPLLRIFAATPNWAAKFKWGEGEIPWRRGDMIEERRTSAAEFRLPPGFYLAEASGGEGIQSMFQPFVVAGAETPVATERVRALADLMPRRKGMTRVLVLLPKPGVWLHWVGGAKGEIRGECKAQGSAVWLDIPLPAHHEAKVPFFVNAMVDGELHGDKLWMECAPEPNPFEIRLKPDRDLAHPGETLGVELDVRSRTGQPVRASVGLAVVDEALFGIVPETLPDQFESLDFHRDFPITTYLLDVSERARSSFALRDLNKSIVREAVNPIPTEPKPSPAPLAPLRLEAKPGSGLLFGTIRGSKEHPNPQATLRLQNAQTRHVLVVDENGNYFSPDLAPGLYSLCVSAKDYQSRCFHLLRIRAGAARRMDVDLAWSPVQSGSAEAVCSMGGPGPRPAPLLPQQEEILANRAQAALRDHFLDTALWIPDLVVKGRKRIQCPLPDDLTTWRMTAVGVGAKGHLAIARAKVQTWKPLQVNLVVPQALTQGDETRAILLVQNRSQKRQRGMASLQVEGGLLPEGSRQKFDLEPGAEARLAFKLLADSNATRIAVRAGAASPAGQDGEKRTVGVKKPGVPCQQQSCIPVWGEASQRLAIPEWMGQEGQVWLYALNGQLEQLVVPSLHYLAQYPYGCVEQTLSSFMAKVQLRGLVNQKGSPLDPALFKNLDQTLKAGLERVYAHQMPNGAWGWYSAVDGGELGNPHTTGYAVACLSALKAGGFEVDGERLSRGIEAARVLLAERWKSGKGDSEKARAAQQGAAFLATCLPVSSLDHQLLEAMIEGALGPRDQHAILALVSLVAVRAGHSNAKALLARLEAGAFETREGVCWPDDGRCGYLQGSAMTTLIALRALCAGKPDSRLIPKAEAYLCAQYQGYGWDSTWKSAQVLSLLPDLAKVRPLNWKGQSMKIQIDGKVVANLEGVDHPFVLPVWAGQSLNIEAKGQGLLVPMLRVDRAHPTVSPAMKNHDLSVDRKIWKLEPSGTPKGYLRTPVPAALKVGDLLWQEVEIEGWGLDYGLLEVPVPAGFEVDLDCTGLTLEGREQSRDRVGRSWITTEVFPDRVAYLIPNLHGKETFRMALRAKVEGRYTLRPAKFSLMGNESVWASSGAQCIPVLSQPGVLP